VSFLGAAFQFTLAPPPGGRVHAPPASLVLSAVLPQPAPGLRPSALLPRQRSGRGAAASATLTQTPLHTHTLTCPGVKIVVIVPRKEAPARLCPQGCFHDPAHRSENILQPQGGVSQFCATPRLWASVTDVPRLLQAHSRQRSTYALTTSITCLFVTVPELDEIRTEALILGRCHVPTDRECNEGQRVSPF